MVRHRLMAEVAASNHVESCAHCSTTNAAKYFTVFLAAPRPSGLSSLALTSRGMSHGAKPSRAAACSALTRPGSRSMARTATGPELDSEELLV